MNLFPYPLSDALGWPLLPPHLSVWNVPTSSLVSSQNLINSSSRPHPTQRLWGSFFKHLPLVMSLFCLHNQGVIDLSLSQKRAMLQILVLPKQWLSQSKTLRQFAEGQRAEVKYRGPWEESVPALRWLVKRIHIGLPSPVQLLSPSKSTEGDLSLNFILLHSRKGTYHLDYRHDIPKRPFFCLRFRKRMALLCFLGWPTSLSLFAGGRKDSVPGDQGHRRPLLRK